MIVGTEKAMLIDTGYDYGDLKRVVKSITEKPLYIVNTHGHVDHTSANALFDEKVYIHPKNMELCRRQRAEKSMSVRNGFHWQRHF